MPASGLVATWRASDISTRPRTIPRCDATGVNPAWLTRAAGSDREARAAGPRLRERPRPCSGFERGGDSREWHQGQGKYAGYRFYSDVSVDNFNAVLYGYAIYYDLAADAGQKAIITQDVDRLMTHLLDNQYRIIDLDGEVTQ